MTRCDPTIRLLATLAAALLAAFATPQGVAALADCNDPALQAETLPDPADPMANGWTSEGPALKGVPPNPPGSTPEIADNDHNAGDARGTAQLFTKQFGDVKCFYLRREFLTNGNPPQPAGTANGVLCFDETDCSVCAWDLKTQAGGADPKGTAFSDMLDASDYGPGGAIDDCSQCHVSGIAIPMNAMYEQINELDLMNTCVEQGGPNWVGAPADWTQPDTARIVPPEDVPAACNGVCHSAGFLSPELPDQAPWCDFAGQSFQDGGSMKEDGYTEEQCVEFMVALACNAAECAAEAAIVPALPNGAAVAGLSALLAAATYLALRRRHPPRTAPE